VNLAPAQPAHPGRRWWLAVVAVVLAQAGLVFLLAERASPQVRSTDREPRVTLSASAGGELAALLDPTLFVWGGARSTAAAVGHAGGPPVQHPPRYTEPPRYLALAAGDLSGIAALLATEPGAAGQPPAPRQAPAPTPTADVLAATALPTNSTCELTGELAARRLPDATPLPPLAYGDVLADTVVQVRVDAAGRVQACTLLARSGLAAADDLALEAVRRFRFAALPGVVRYPAGPLAPLASGEVVFRWRTVAP